MRTRPARPRLSPHLLALSLLAAACGGPPEPATEPPPPPPIATPAPPAEPPPPSRPAPEKLAADAARATSQGTTFSAPGGWAITSDGPLVVLDTPEPDTHLVIFEAPAGTAADAAVAAAWKAYNPAFVRPLKLASPRPGRKGWDEVHVYDYETSPNEHAEVFAVARRHGDAWTVALVDASQSTFNKRGAAARLVLDSLRPKGYARETFAGKKAHPLDKERVKLMTDFLEAAMKETGTPGAALALVDGGKVVFEGGFGVKELGKPARVDKDTLFAIASNTKGMTTLLLAKLVDQGKLAWDTPVTQLYPGFKLGDADATSKMLVKHLVCACTGLPRQDLEWIFEYSKYTPQRTMDLLGTMQPTSKFGEIFQYSNVLASAGGYVAAHVLYPTKELGAAYDEAMKKLVFDPLGMKSATFDMDRMLKANHAGAHSWDIDNKPAAGKIDMNRSAIAIRPGGGAWISVHDMTRYVLLELDRGALPGGKRYVSEANLLARRAPSVPIGEDAIYGMGLEVESPWGTPFVHHGGSLWGFKSDWVIFPEHGAGAVLLTNSDAGGMILRGFVRRLAEILFDGRPEALEDVAFRAKTQAAEIAKDRERLVVPPDPEVAGKLAARYTSNGLGDLAVKKQGAATVFDFGEIASAVASRKNDDGTISFITVDPGIIGFELVVGERGGKRVLVVRDAQHEYVFTDAG